MTDEYTGWAIEARSRGPLGNRAHLLGRYWFANAPIPAHMEGHHFMLFKTRREARSALPAKWDVMGNVHWYVPVKVIVVIAPFQRAATPGRRKKDKGTK